MISYVSTNEVISGLEFEIFVSSGNEFMGEYVSKSLAYTLPLEVPIISCLLLLSTTKDRPSISNSISIIVFIELLSSLIKSSLTNMKRLPSKGLTAVS